MTRYLVNAAIEVDAWAHVEADNFGDAVEKAHALRLGDFEQGDALFVAIRTVGLEDDAYKSPLVRGGRET